MDAKRIENAQKILDWAIGSLHLDIKCMAINYKDDKYKVQFFTRENKVIRGVGISIPEEWIRDTNPVKNDIHVELESLLIKLKQEAKGEKR